jgi:hypothetical protein
MQPKNKSNQISLDNNNLLIKKSRKTRRKKILFCGINFQNRSKEKFLSFSKLSEIGNKKNY